MSRAAEHSESAQHQWLQASAPHTRNSLESIGQRIEAEGWNAEETLGDDRQLLAEDAQLHLLSQKGGGKVGRRRDQHNQVLQSPISSPATSYNP